MISFHPCWGGSRCSILHGRCYHATSRMGGSSFASQAHFHPQLLDSHSSTRRHIPNFLATSPSLFPRGRGVFLNELATPEQHLPRTSGGTMKLAPKKITFSLDPQPDWTLDDLKRELDILTGSLKTPTLPDEHPLRVNATCVSWRELSVAADFGRDSRAFRISAYDSDSDQSDEELEFASEYGGEDLANDKTDTEQSSDTYRFLSGAESCLFPRAEPVEGSLYELERERLMRVQEEVRLRHWSLEAAMEEESCRSSVVFKQVEKEKDLKHEMVRRTDKQYQRSIAEARDQHLSALQRDHEQRSQVEERRIRKEAAAEEARRREIAAQEERERQEIAKTEAEVKRKADALIARKAAAEAERKKQADAAAATAALQRAEEEKKKRQQAEQDKRESATTTTPAEKNKEGQKPIVADSAASLETQRMQKMRLLEDEARHLLSNPGLKKDLKNCERSIVKLLQQVAATQEQVGKKSAEMLGMLKNPSNHLAFVMVTFASKLMSQIEAQVLKLPSYAFPLAQVVVNVSSQIPDVIIPVLAMLHQNCILTVPKYYVFRQSQFDTDRAYYKALGYKEDEGKLESTDSYLERMSAYMTFYAAIIQAEGPGGYNPHGLKEGWVWCAQLLNKLPAGRVTGSAVHAFLKVAGYRLHQVYPKAFMKLTRAIVSEFIVNLKANDPNSKAVINRLETYLYAQEYLNEPVGHSMSITDISSVMKA